MGAIAYTHDGAVYCTGCCDAEEDNPEQGAIFPWDEVDHHGLFCSACQRAIVDPQSPPFVRLFVADSGRAFREEKCGQGWIPSGIPDYVADAINDMDHHHVIEFLDDDGLLNLAVGTEVRRAG
jgi:hypothetical protein